MKGGSSKADINSINFDCNLLLPKTRPSKRKDFFLKELRFIINF